MDAQELFYVVGTISLLLVSAFIIFLIVVLFQLRNMGKRAFEELRLASKDLQGSISTIAKSWGKIKLVGLIFRTLRLFVRR